jgi:ABC-type lipoprotein export system ATPase subunit
MVTHDPRYADRATRSVQLFDGKVVGAHGTDESGAEALRRC